MSLKNISIFSKQYQKCVLLAYVFIVFVSIAGSANTSIRLSMTPATHKEIFAQELLRNSLSIKGPFTTEILSGGLSGSSIIKVKASDKSYVVRFWNMEQWADDFVQDAACQSIASNAGYGPKLYFTDVANGVTVMNYHFPEALPEFQLRLQTLTDLLKKIHRGPSVPEGIDRSIYLDLLVEEIKGTRLVDIEAIKEIKDSIFAATRSNAQSLPCHRDLHHGNLIYTQSKFLAIDYTWGAMDDPYVDLAVIAIFNCKNLEEEKLLLHLYLEREPTHKEMSRLALMKQPIKIFYGLEFFKVASSKMSNELVTSQIPTKNYMNFGLRRESILNSTEFLTYAMSLLAEVVEYSLSRQYVEDLSKVRESLE